MARVVGITGTIASGKSLVGKLLAEAGILVLDTDHIGHEVEAKDPGVRRAIAARFGADIFQADGLLDRKRLGKIVFDDASARQDLNKIVHPAIVQECRRRIEENADAALVAVLVPLLFEVGLEKNYDEIWTVIAADEIVMQRLMSRDGISKEDAQKRINAQFPQAEKIRRSKHVIDNSGTADDTKMQVLELLGRVLR